MATTANKGIDLATTTAFRLGPLLVEPSLRAVSTTSRETLEPRVMKVLVALVRADGAVLSRDSLIDQCWDGQIVGDDAVQRAVGRLRRLADERGDGAFHIETVPRVGYRLVGSVSPAATTDVPTAVATWLPASVPALTGGAGLIDRRVAFGSGVIIAAVLATAVAWQAHLFGHPDPRPVVEVEAFTATAAGVSPGLVAELRAETADFLANEKFYAVSTPSHVGRDRPDWRIGGTIAPADNGRRLVVFAQLYRAGSNAAVVELRIDRDAAQPMLARSLGLRIGRTAGCVVLGVTNADLTGGFVETAMPAFAASCVTWHDKTSSMAARIERFRDNAAALPRSAYFRARLGEMLGDLAADGAANATALRTEGAVYVAAAEQIDPGQPHIFLAQARLRPADDFAGREAMFLKALAARPSDCACEFGDYSTFLSMVGRNAEARTYAARAHEKEPKNIPWLRRAGETAAVAGAYDDARAELSDVAGYLPEPSNLDDWRMNLGVWSKDWPLARSMIERQPDPALRALQTAMIAALATGDAARIRATGLPFLARAKVAATNDRTNVTALAMSGFDAGAVAAAGRLLDRHPFAVSLLFEPSFAAARHTPEFATLATKVGLVNYWRKSGRAPDFCLAAAPPALCARLPRGG